MHVRRGKEKRRKRGNKRRKKRKFGLRRRARRTLKKSPKMKLTIFSKRESVLSVWITFRK